MPLPPFPPRLPRLIPREPRRRETPPEIEIFPDTAEQCCTSVDRTGLRPQLDKAFTDAIARANKRYARP